MEYKELSTNPAEVFLQLAGAKWKLHVIRHLLNKEMRFCELKKKIGCTSKVLTSCLKDMEKDGLVIREKDEKEFNKVEYYLTDVGYTMRPVIDAIQKWGKEYKRLRKLMDIYSQN